MRVTALVNMTYHGVESALGWTPETDLHAGPRTTMEEVNAHINNESCRIILLEQVGQLIGCALIERHGAEAHLGMFAVSPRLQASGFGRAILAEAERQAVDLWRCRAMTMSVISSQSALIAYYLRRGYHLTGERLPFPFDEQPGALRTDYDLVIVRKDLSPN